MKVLCPGGSAFLPVFPIYTPEGLLSSGSSLVALVRVWVEKNKLHDLFSCSKVKTFSIRLNFLIYLHHGVLWSTQIKHVLSATWKHDNIFFSTDSICSSLPHCKLSSNNLLHFRLPIYIWYIPMSNKYVYLKMITEAFLNQMHHKSKSYR